MLWHNINPLSYTTWSHCMTNTFTWHFHFLFWVTVLSRVAQGLALPPRCCSIHMLYFLVWDWKVSLKWERSGPWQPFWTAVIYKPFIVEVRYPSLSLSPPPVCTGHSFTRFLVPVWCIRKKGICKQTCLDWLWYQKILFLLLRFIFKLSTRLTAPSGHSHPDLSF